MSVSYSKLATSGGFYSLHQQKRPTINHSTHFQDSLEALRGNVTKLLAFIWPINIPHRKLVLKASLIKKANKTLKPIQSVGNHYHFSLKPFRVFLHRGNVSCFTATWL